jgi:hypothetical protein
MGSSERQLIETTRICVYSNRGGAGSWPPCWWGWWGDGGGGDGRAVSTAQQHSGRNCALHLDINVDILGEKLTDGGS